MKRRREEESKRGRAEERASPAAPLRIGTRGSPLALAQAYMTRQLLMDNFEELSSEGAIQLVRSCFLF